MVKHFCDICGVSGFILPSNRISDMEQSEGFINACINKGITDVCTDCYKVMCSLDIAQGIREAIERRVFPQPGKATEEAAE